MEDVTKSSLQSLANILQIYASVEGSRKSKKIEEKIKELESKVVGIMNDSVHNQVSTDIINKMVQNTNKIDQNIEFILQKVDHGFNEYENSYMLFELMIYALSANNGLEYIEEAIDKSKVIKELMQSYYFKSDIQIQAEKTSIALFAHNLQKYEKTTFSKLSKLNIIIDKSMPPSLIMDTPKIQSIILHLMYDLYAFVDYSQDVNIKLLFDDKVLILELGGFIHKQNSLFKSIFKRGNPLDDEKNRQGLQLAILLVDRLRGKIKSTYEDQYYKFEVSLPVSILKF